MTGVPEQTNTIFELPVHEDKEWEAMHEAINSRNVEFNMFDNDSDTESTSDSNVCTMVDTVPEKEDDIAEVTGNPSPKPTENPCNEERNTNMSNMHSPSRNSLFTVEKGIIVDFDLSALDVDQTAASELFKV